MNVLLTSAAGISILIIFDSWIVGSYGCSRGGGYLSDAGMDQDAMIQMMMNKLIQQKVQAAMNRPQRRQRKRKDGSNSMLKMMALMMVMNGGAGGGAGGMDLASMGALMGAMGGGGGAAAAPAAAAPAAAVPTKSEGPADAGMFDGPAPGGAGDVDGGGGAGATAAPVAETTKFKPHPTFTDKYGKPLPKPAWHP